MARVGLPSPGSVARVATTATKTLADRNGPSPPESNPNRPRIDDLGTGGNGSVWYGSRHALPEREPLKQSNPALLPPSYTTESALVNEGQIRPNMASPAAHQPPNRATARPAWSRPIEPAAGG
ncbi:hypothetical protein [Isosphaera pallida]|uniref:hypothetical protein n=1 Tax=Isosphaera pallida TaxID=128 RepID=UPI00030B4AA2|nr:hypothetical protein [Isosphaera pallida]